MDISEESLNRSGCSLPDQTRPKLNTSRERSIQADLTEHRSFKDTGVGSGTGMDLWSTPRKLDHLQPPIMSPIGPERTRARGSDSSTPDRTRRRRPRQKDSSGLEGNYTDLLKAPTACSDFLAPNFTNNSIEQGNRNIRFRLLV